MAGLPDLVCPVRVARSNEELRYALRSWAAHLPHRRVWLVGHRPHWVSGEAGHIPTEQTGSKWENTTTAIRAACEHPDVSERFVWTNDDFFLMHPLPDGMPVLHRGLLRDVLARRVTRPGHGSRDEYGAGLQAAATRLEELGYPDPLCYEHHSPLPVDKTVMLRAVEAGVDVAKRSVYGALAGLGGEFAEDVKINWRRPQGFGPDLPFLSTAPDAFAHGAVGRYIRERFPDRCRYEKRGH